jgi:2Fe-2S ferredoxin
MPRIEIIEQAEAIMLECALDVRPNSRLTCQIIINSHLDGIVMRLPGAQV